MLSSMTGYGRAAAADGGLTATVQVRTVNHRYLDIYVRMPTSIMALEDAVRQAAQRRLRRGRVEIVVAVEDSERASRTLHLDRAFLSQAKAALEEAAALLGVEPRVELAHLSLVPGVFRLEEAEADLERVRGVVLQALEAALDQVVAMRRAEGQALAADIAQRIDTVERIANEVRERAPQVVQELFARLKRRIAELAGDVALDPGRLEMEAALLADRSDISEELARIGSHVSQLRALLHGDEGDGVGRKLDFLLQELNREWNTIGSKANDAAIAQWVVEARAELEKIREQVQNIE